MKFLGICIFLIFMGHKQLVEGSLQNPGVGQIHQKITAVPSDGSKLPKTIDNRTVPIIERTIKLLYRPRRHFNENPTTYSDTNKNSDLTTSYPKHHYLQPVATEAPEPQPQKDLTPGKVSYSDGHHSWKKTSLLNHV